MTDLQQELQKGVFELNDSSDRFKNNIFRISEIVGCPARIFYHRKLGLRPIMKGRMLSGIIFHEHLQDIVKNIPEFANAEFEPECCQDFGDYKIVGHIDILTADTVFEFKFSACDMQKYGVPEYWHLQANCYASITKRPFYKIVQVHSQDLSVTVIEGQQNEEMFQVLKDRAKTVFDCLQTGVVPVGPLADWQCWDCECKEVCENFKAKIKEENKHRIIELEK